VSTQYQRSGGDAAADLAGECRLQAEPRILLEGGLRSTFANGRVDASASLFTITQDDIVTRDPNNFNLSVQGGRRRRPASNCRWRRM
jgi:hypothetical protein